MTLGAFQAVAASTHTNTLSLLQGKAWLSPLDYLQMFTIGARDRDSPNSGGRRRHIPCSALR